MQQELDEAEANMEKYKDAYFEGFSEEGESESDNFSRALSDS